MILSTIRRAARQFLPAPIARPLQALQLWPPARYLWDNRFRQEIRAMRHLRDHTRSVVIGGPFKGMRYVARSTGSAYGPKLLGTYELELWPVIEQIARTAYEVIIDVGAAEGYYAVGLAMRRPEARIIAFEAQESSHCLIHDLATRNNVGDRIDVRGLCTGASLKPLLENNLHTLLICDAEGAEHTVLDPLKTPELTHLDILVEIHDFIIPGIGKEIKRRFAATHDIESIISQPRSLNDWPAAVEFPQEFQMVCMHEKRPVVMEWLWMKARP